MLIRFSTDKNDIDGAVLSCGSFNLKKVRVINLDDALHGRITPGLQQILNAFGPTDPSSFRFEVYQEEAMVLLLSFRWVRLLHLPVRAVRQNPRGSPVKMVVQLQIDVNDAEILGTRIALNLVSNRRLKPPGQRISNGPMRLSGRGSMASFFEESICQGTLF